MVARSPVCSKPSPALAANLTPSQGEASPLITQASLYDTEEDRDLTIGRPLPQVEVKIIDTVTGATLPVGEQGELCARGYQVMLGYYDMPEKTAAAIDAEVCESSDDQSRRAGCLVRLERSEMRRSGAFPPLRPLRGCCPDAGNEALFATARLCRRQISRPD